MLANISINNLWQVVKSVAASAIGVQSNKNREHDFEQKSPLPYIVVGVVFVMLFIMSILLVVNSLV
jgi:hypothetical protein